MEAAAKPASPMRTLRQRQRRLPLAQLLFAAAGVAVLLVCGAYGLRFVSASAFHKERAFRVLDEIGSQLDSLQRTLANQLRLLPTELVGKPCAKEFVGASQLTEYCKKKREDYQRRLALQGPKVSVASVSTALLTRACAQGNRFGAALRASEPGVPFTAFSCDMATPADEPAKTLAAAFTGSMAETVEGFVSQGYFDEVLLALEDGTVIATMPLRSGAKSTAVELQPAKPRRLGITNVAPMLRNEAAADGESKKQEGKASVPGQPQTFSTKIAEDSYRVFVRGVQPRYGTYVETDEDKPALRQERLFLVGLKREDLRAELASSMEPGGRFLLTILTLLAFLVWPLATLRSKSPDDPIAWTEAIACLAAVVLIPAVLAIATVWVWSYQGLLQWADAGAERYARSVSAALDKELQESRRMLGEYRSLYREADSFTGAATVRVPIRSRDDGDLVYGEITASSCKKTVDRTCVIDVTPAAATQWRGWSTFSSVFATDGDGLRDGTRLTVYDPPQVKPDASYDNREYFRILQRGEGWAVDAAANGDRYVAQRLFSGSDGARVMQVAIPRSEAPNCEGNFCGIITGSATVHSLAAAVSPPLLKFAVIDRNSGIVVFHSNDSRSLAENFFVETERNPELLALSQLAQDGFFSGRYLGAGYRFFHQPVKDTPWSVVVFYSLKEVGDLPWHAVFTALAAYAGALLVLLSASCLAVWLWAKRNRKGALNIAAGFWLRGASCSYARWGLALFGCGLTLVTLYELSVGGPISLITRVMWGLLALAAAAVLLQHRFSIHSVCISLWVLLISGIPAAWMALGYHDVQVQGLLRDGLISAASDIQSRKMLIAGDLHRWLSSNEGRDQDFPEPWQLTKPSTAMPVPGYSLGSCNGAPVTEELRDVWALCVFDAPPLATLIARRDLDFWRRETWDASVQAETQQRRIRLLGQMDVVRSSPFCESKDSAERCRFKNADGQSFELRAEPVTAAGDTGAVDDDRRFEGIAGFLTGVLALVTAMLITWLLSMFISRRLLGHGLRGHAHTATIGPAVSIQQAVLFYERELAPEEVDQLALELQSGKAGSPAIQRINLATKALYDAFAGDKQLADRVLFTNLDIALADAARRRDILEVLERLVDDPNIHLLILCRRSPIDQLYHPERYPESGPEHMLPLQESLRWDNVLQKFGCRDLSNMDPQQTHPYLATIDHHRTWKQCTRSERLLLYELATGRLANPRNTVVIESLMKRGLLTIDPWPKIANESFEAFVRTAETTDELAHWQQYAQGAGKRVRSALIAILLVALLIAVVWFSWSAGDKFRVVSTIVVGAVAFLGKIGEAFNFVRSGSGLTGRSSS